MLATHFLLKYFVKYILLGLLPFVNWTSVLGVFVRFRAISAFLGLLGLHWIVDSFAKITETRMQFPATRKHVTPDI